MAKPTEAERFWAKVDRSGGSDACWPWLGWVSRCGYGYCYVSGIGTVGAHRRSWILTNGPIASGLHIDHQCHNRDLSCARGNTCLHRRCVNPAHLEPATPKENLRRGLSRRGGLCSRGHLVEGDNVYVQPSTGQTICRLCRAINKRDENARIRVRLAVSTPKDATPRETT